MNVIEADMKIVNVKYFCYSLLRASGLFKHNLNKTIMSAYQALFLDFKGKDAKIISIKIYLLEWLNVLKI